MQPIVRGVERVEFSVVSSRQCCNQNSLLHLPIGCVDADFASLVRFRLNSSNFFLRPQMGSYAHQTLEICMLQLAALPVFTHLERPV